MNFLGATKRKWRGKEFGILLAVIAICMTGCKNEMPEANQSTTQYELAWLGAIVSPQTKVIRFESKDQRQLTGGLIVQELTDSSVLTKIGIKAGDTIVGVADLWLPIVENPTLDFLRSLENQIEAKQQKIELFWVHQRQLKSEHIEIPVSPLSEGLPQASKRLLQLAALTADKIASLQAEDGSFDSNIFKTESVDGRIKCSSVVGLALMSVNGAFERDFSDTIDYCEQFVARSLDAGIEITPEIAAYVALFLAERRVDLSDEIWLERILKLVDIFESNQHESGCWFYTKTSAEDLAEDSEMKPDETLTTCLVLNALGALERAGFAAEQKTIETACEFLKRQNLARNRTRMDPRIRSILVASTVAALRSINCPLTTPELKNYMEEASQWSHEVFDSPRFAMDGLLQFSIISRQHRPMQWLKFFDATKHLLVMYSNLDGTNDWSENLGEQTKSSDPWVLAHFTIAQSIGIGNLKILLNEDSYFDQPIRNIEGQPIAKIADLTTPRKDQTNGLDAKALKKMILDQLKSRGMDVDTQDEKE